MQTGKVNFIFDAMWGSSGKGKTSTWLADDFNIRHVSSSNFPNAGHTAAFEDGTKFIAKAIPTASILKKVKGIGIDCYLSPGSGFDTVQLCREWFWAGRPNIFIHSRASFVDESHKAREREGSESTKHIASTMQGSAAAIVDKVLRKENCALAYKATSTKDWLYHAYNTDPTTAKILDGLADGPARRDAFQEFSDKVRVIEAMDFRDMTHSALERGHAWLHEGSQGYALSIDHGSHYPQCTSRNCGVQSSMDQMAIPASLVGDVYMNLRTKPIRVGNVVEDGVQKGYSGDFYSDCEELTWEQVARDAGMPPSEAAALAERERTTVTKRVRRVCTFSFVGLKDATRVNGATKLVVNFIQYISWSDNGVREFSKLSKKSRDFIEQVENAANRPVVLVGTGANHNEMIAREDLL